MRNEEWIVCEICATWADLKEPSMLDITAEGKLTAVDSQSSKNYDRGSAAPIELKCKPGNPLTAMVADPNVPRVKRHVTWPLSVRAE